MRMDEALAAVDHIAARMTASSLTGLGCGAAYATYKGFPLVKTSTSAALSCALVSTACFGMERAVHYAFTKSSSMMGDPHDDDNKFGIRSNPEMHYGSHALGGLFGGSVVGYLFQGRPFAGAFLLTPIMLGVGKIESSLDDYRIKRLQQLTEMNDSVNDSREK